jgi:hypothetical protein
VIYLKLRKKLLLVKAEQNSLKMMIFLNLTILSKKSQFAELVHNNNCCCLS